MTGLVSSSRQNTTSEVDLPCCSKTQDRPNTKRRMAAWVRNLSTLRAKKRVGAASSQKSRLRDITDFSDDEIEADDGGVYIGDDVSLDPEFGIFLTMVAYFSASLLAFYLGNNFQRLFLLEPWVCWASRVTGESKN